MSCTEPPSTWPSLLAKLVAERGDHPAIITTIETLSYRELEECTSKMARALLAAGAGKGTRIGLLAPDGTFWLTAFLAGLRIGALVTAISTLATPSELAHILRHSDIQFLVSARRFLRHDYAAILRAALPGLDTARAGAMMLAHAPHLRTIWLDDATGLPWAHPVDDLLALAEGPDAPDAALLYEIEREVSPADEAVVVYTSGSTAQPKAVLHCQWSVARHPPELAHNFVMTPDDRMMCLLPLFWLAGMSTALQVLSIGATLVYPDTPEVTDALDTISRFGVTRVNAWGDKQPRLIAAAKERGMDLSHIPELSCFHDSNGDPLPTKISMYGMTESFSAHSAEPLNVSLPEDKAKSFGRAIHGYERRVIDPESGVEVPPGVVGELQIRGPALMVGFYKARREDVFTPDGFYPTKDLVRIDEDGWLYPAGRMGDMIKSKGANISRLEVEAALTALPDVAQAVVTGLPDSAMGEILVAAVVPGEGNSPSEESLRQALHDTLSSFKIPRRIVLITENEVPRTVTGKVKLFEVKNIIAEKIG